MTKHSRKTQQSRTNLKELGVVTATDSLDLARDYEVLLKNNEIPVMIKEQRDDEMQGKSFAIMVPEEYIDEAHVVIESQNAYDDFYDLALEDGEEDNFDADFFEDDF